MTHHLSDRLKTLIVKTGYLHGPNREVVLQTFGELWTSLRRPDVEPQAVFMIMVGGVLSYSAHHMMPMLLDFALEQQDLRDAASQALASSNTSVTNPEVYIAGLMREAGLKTISFNGVPVGIECLKSLSQGIAAHPAILEGLTTQPRREITVNNLADVDARGKALWEKVYEPVSSRVLDVLGKAHPDLPGHILHSHYSALLSPLPPSLSLPWDVTGPLLSILAVACLRQNQLANFDLQIESHVRGLLKQSSGGFLSTEEGCIWLLEAIDGFDDSMSGLV